MTDLLPGMQLSPAFSDDVTCRYHTPAGIEQAPRATQTPLPRSRPFQWLHSFSGLTRYAAAAVVIDDSGAADEVGIGYRRGRGRALLEVADDADCWRVYPLRGPRFGDAVHHMLELARPAPVWPEQRQLLNTQLTAQAIKPNSVSPDEVLERVGRLIDRVRQSDLGDGLRLIDIPADQRIVEFEFQFPVQQVAGPVAPAMHRPRQPDVVPASLDTTTLNGMLTGFADLIVEWDGRFPRARLQDQLARHEVAGLSGTSLNAAMAEHHYPLQALLYTVALHRYLRQRMDGYTGRIIILATAGICLCARSGLEPGSEKTLAYGGIAGRRP
jgi:exodeoxyribonuclease V beta subunit